MLRDIFEDSILLQNLLQNSEDDIGKDSDKKRDILDSISIFIDMNIIYQFYKDEFDFNDDIKLLKLLEDFRYLENRNINEILIIMKWKNNPKNKISEYLIPSYNDIILKESLFLTLIFYNVIYSLNFYYNEDELYRAFEISILQNNKNSFNFLTNKENHFSTSKKDTIYKLISNLDKIEKEWNQYYFDFILKREDKVNWDAISMNQNITMDIIEQYPNKPWNWKYVSKNPNITMDIIEKHPDKNWHWESISANPNITTDIIEEYPDNSWDWYSISSNPNITIEFIEKYPNKNWDWINITKNISITMDIIEKHPDKPWDWYDITENPNIAMEFLEKYPNKGWIWCSMSANPNITMNIIEKYPNKDWNYFYLSQNPNITMDIIDKYYYKPWDWINISENPNITMNIINKYSNKPWKWDYIIKNPNITIEFIEKYPNKNWNWSNMSYNKFTEERKIFVFWKAKFYFGNLISDKLINILIKDVNKTRELMTDI